MKIIVEGRGQNFVYVYYVIGNKEVVPVSYTHLDVYKRQIYECTPVHHQLHKNESAEWKSTAAVEIFLKNADLHYHCYEECWQYFNIKRHDSILSEQAVRLWMKNFEATVTPLEQKSIESPRNIQTQEKELSLIHIYISHINTKFSL